MDFSFSCEQVFKALDNGTREFLIAPVSKSITPDDPSLTFPLRVPDMNVLLSPLPEPMALRVSLNQNDVLMYLLQQL